MGLMAEAETTKHSQFKFVYVMPIKTESDPNCWQQHTSSLDAGQKRKNCISPFINLPLFDSGNS